MGLAIVEVNEETEHGTPTGRRVEVFLEYVLTVDGSYGADADGRRGIVVKEWEVTNVELFPPLPPGWRRDNVVTMAENLFYQSPGRYVCG